MPDDLRQLLWFLIAGGRGGLSRARLLEEIHTRPNNAHRLAAVLNLDYRTVRYHLSLLEENGLVTRSGERSYGEPYSIAPSLLDQFELVREIRVRVERSEAFPLSGPNPG